MRLRAYVAMDNHFHYKAKDGSFKAYGVVNGRPKAYSFTVLGVVMDGVGYGTAALKKPAVTIPITIE